jgi:hypothetical protein
MRMITHFALEIARTDGLAVAVRSFSLECELQGLCGVRIPQVALSVDRPDGEPEVWSVEADARLSSLAERCYAHRDWQPLLDHLAERYSGHPMGHLADRVLNRTLLAG